MRTRRKAREATLQALYQCDTQGEWTKEIIELCFLTFWKKGEGPQEEVETTDNAQDSLSSTGKVARLIELEKENRAFAESLILGVIEYLDFIDSQISQASSNWSLARMSKVDRNILRLAAFEMAFLPDIPRNVSLNEAIEIAKTYGSEDSHMFVNGVLDNIAKVLEHNPHLVDLAKTRQERKILAVG